MDRFDSYDFYNSDGLRRDSRLDRDIERSAVGRRQTIVTLIEKDAPAHTIAYHEALKLDPMRWAALEYRGTTCIEADETGPATKLVYRNCSCHSTLAVFQTVTK